MRKSFRHLILAPCCLLLLITLPAGAQERESGPGATQRLPHQERLREPFDGADRRAIRPHTDREADAAAAAMGAEAWATSKDIAPAGAPDKSTIAHEATHVVQQKSGPLPPAKAEKPAEGSEARPE